MLELHQSELATYRRCRRKWALSSPNMSNLIANGPEPQALWFGTGVHFALEDYHGWNRYGGLLYAFLAYYEATRDTRPEGAGELRDLAAGMFDHYESWLEHRSDFETLHIDGQPQVEVNWQVPIPGIDPSAAQLAGTFDRLVTDPHGRVWVLDYKTCGQFNTAKLDLDPQVSVYCWAFRELYGYAPEGMVYVQLRKAKPEPPKRLKSGALSVDKTQNTTWELYRTAVFDKSPSDAEMSFLAWLRDQEDDAGDRFIRRDLVRRNEWQIAAVGEWLFAQARDIGDLKYERPNSKWLYPNPTHECGMCPFHSLCLAMDDGSDWAAMQSGLYAQREGGNNPWRQNLPAPTPALTPWSAPDPCPQPKRPQAGSIQFRP